VVFSLAIRRLGQYDAWQSHPDPLDPQASPRLRHPPPDQCDLLGEEQAVA
jgi:hypothetical protein